MGEKIQLYMEDWMKNAGIVGLCNILKNSGDSVIFYENYVEFESEFLVDFEKKYFSYFREKYKNTTVYSRLSENIEYLINKNEIDIDTKKHEKELKYIKEKLKNSAYKEIKDNVEMAKLNQPTVEFLKEILTEINSKKEYILEKETTGYYDQRVRNSKSPNAVIDKYINTNMLKIKESSNIVLRYIQEDTEKYKIKCFTCENRVKKINTGLSFLNNIYFDTSRKTSHVWDFNNDIEICPICKLVYFCIPAGFTTIYGKGMYINITNSIEQAININERFRIDVLEQYRKGQSLTYKSLVKAINERDNEIIRYELVDIQLIRCEDNTYKFNLLSRNALRIIRYSKEDLNNLLDCGFKEINTYFNVYELVIDRLLNNQNMFTLAQKLLHYKLSQPKDSYYNSYHILKILDINIRFLKEVGYMKESDKDIVKLGNNAGFFLRKQYKDKGSVDKLTGISYRLLNSLKTNNINSFMDTVLNCYLYTKESVPKVIVDSLKDEEQFKTIGYAFVAGLIEGKASE